MLLGLSLLLYRCSGSKLIYFVTQVYGDSMYRYRCLVCRREFVVQKKVSCCIFCGSEKIMLQSSKYYIRVWRDGEKK